MSMSGEPSERPEGLVDPIERLKHKSHPTLELRRPSDNESLRLIGAPKEKIATWSSSFTCWATTSSQNKLILVTLFLVQLTDVMCISVMAPFFPKEAENKGLSPQAIGWIFAVFPLIRFVSSPLLGKLLPYSGCRNMVVVGQIWTGVFFILFGFLDYVESGPNDESNLYISLCFLFRIMTALGSAASGTAGFAIVSIKFTDELAQRYGVLQSAVGFGLIIGPALGGLLYASGGYVVPFSVLGSTIFLTIPLCIFSLPRDEVVEEAGHVDCVRASYLLQNATVILMGVSILVAAFIWSSLEPTLEPHLRQFNLSPVLLGLVYFMIGAMYIIFCPLVGWISDKKPDSPLLLMIVGFILSAFCLILLGPSPILGSISSESYFWLNLVSLGTFGVAASFAVVPCYNKILLAASSSQMDMSFGLNSFIAGYFNSCWSFGEFIGPLMGAALVELSGFGWANTFTAGLCCAVTVCIIVLYIYERHIAAQPSSINYKRKKESHSDDKEIPSTMKGD